MPDDARDTAAQRLLESALRNDIAAAHSILPSALKAGVDGVEAALVAADLLFDHDTADERARWCAEVAKAPNAGDTAAIAAAAAHVDNGDLASALEVLEGADSPAHRGDAAWLMAICRSGTGDWRGALAALRAAPRSSTAPPFVELLEAELTARSVLEEQWVELAPGDERRIPRSIDALGALQDATDRILALAEPGSSLAEQAEHTLVWTELCSQEISRVRIATVVGGLVAVFGLLSLAPALQSGLVLALPLTWLVSLGLYVTWARGPRWQVALDDRRRTFGVSALADFGWGLVLPLAAWRMRESRQAARRFDVALAPGGFAYDQSPSARVETPTAEGGASSWLSESPRDRPGPCPFVSTIRATKDLVFEGRKVDTGSVILEVREDWKVRVDGLDWGWIDDRGRIHRGIPLAGIDPTTGLFDAEVAHLMGSSGLLLVGHDVVGSRGLF